MKKKLIIGVIIGVIVVFSFMFWSAQKTRKTSDNILEDFKKIEKSLDSSDEALRKANDSLYKKINITQEEK
jgi:predicted negative regulator of RcsB-dependent stress response